MKFLRCKVYQIETYMVDVPLTPKEAKRATTAEECMKLLQHDFASWDLLDVTQEVVEGTQEITEDEDKDEDESEATNPEAPDPPEVPSD